MGNSPHTQSGRLRRLARLCYKGAITRYLRMSMSRPGPWSPAAPSAAADAARRGRVLLCVSGTSFMIMLDSNIVAVSLPSIAHNLHAAFADIEWVVSSYVLTFAALLMPAGALADRYGRRRLLAAGLALFTLASLLCGLAPGAAVLNGARALQGIGAALQLSAALAVLGDEFRGAERVRAFSVWGTVIGIAVAAGPPVGGVITSTLGWRWAFLVNVPVGVLLVALALTAVRESKDPGARRLDVAGMLLFGCGLFCLVWALIDGNAAGWSSRPTLLKLAGGTALMAAFVAAERAQQRPMVDFGLFRRRSFLGSAVAMLGFAAAAQVMMTYLPLYLQNVFGQSPAAAGLAMLPFALPLFFCPRIGAHLATRLSGRALLTFGLILVALGNAATALAVGGGATYPLLALAMVVTGCGAGFLNGETAKVMMGAVPPERGGMASGVSATLRFVGLVTGITGLGAVLTGRTAGYLKSAAAAGPDPGGDRHALVSRIVAGEFSSLADVADPARAALGRLARLSFASGFTTVLWVAAAIAAVAAWFTFRLVSAAETAPHAAPAVSPAPEMID